MYIQRCLPIFYNSKFCVGTCIPNTKDQTTYTYLCIDRNKT